MKIFFSGTPPHANLLRLLLLGIIAKAISLKVFWYALVDIMTEVYCS